MTPDPTPEMSQTTGKRAVDRHVGWWVALIAIAAAAALFWPRGEGSRDGSTGTVFDVEGKQVELESRFAPVTLLHFWATWCPPCVTEIPALDRLRLELEKRPGFAIVMVAVQDDRERARDFLKGQGSGLLLDPTADVAHRYGTFKLPETYLMVGGEVVEKFVGSTDWDDPEIRRRILDRLAPAGS